MRHWLIAVALLLSAQSVYAASISSVGGGGVGVGETAFPASPYTGQVVVITDDPSVGACTSAGGASVSLCRWSGAAWEKLGDGTLGSGLASTDIDTCAEIAAIVTGETGTCGSLVLSDSPTLVTPNLGTPSTLVGTNITGTAAGLTAGTATTANSGDSATAFFSSGTIEDARLPSSMADKVFTGSILLPNGTAVPGTCSIGMLYFDNDATAGVNLYGCTASNTWTLLGDGGGAGSVATDPIWDAAGDLVYGTGANTASRLAPGTTGQVLVLGTGPVAPAWSSTLTALTSISFGADPGDGSPLNLSNNTCINWEIATPGTDKCLKVDASDQLDFNGTFNLSGPTTGSMQINGSTSGSLKITTADATAQAITITGAAQTTGAATLTIPDQGGTSRNFVFDTLTQTLTGKTIDCTSAGNVCTITKTIDLPLVGVSGGTAGHVWDDAPTLTACTPGSAAGTNQTVAYCTFPDSDGDIGRAIPLHLPASFVADSVTFIVDWKTTGTGNARFRVRTICYASDEAGDSAYSNSSYVTAAAGTSGRWNKSASTAVTTTGCAAGETMWVQFERNRTEASDSLNAALDVRKIILAWQEAQ